MKAGKKSVKYTDDQTPPTPLVNETAAPEITEIGAFEAKTHLSAILEKVAQGASFYITKRGKRIAEIKPVEKKSCAVELGLWRGKIWIADDFDAPLEEFKEYME